MTIQASQPAAATAERKSGPRILMVDDNAATCELMDEILTSAEMDCLALTDSREAAALVAKEKFDAIFTDEHMPYVDGIELARRARAGFNRSTPIVMITGEEDRKFLGRAFDAGVNFFLFKPIDRHSVLRLIRVTEGTIQREARRFQRIKFNGKVSIESGAGNLNGATLDVSLGGMFVQAPYVLPVGSLVTVGLELLPDQPSVRLSARVMRVAGGDCMGLQIENTASADYKEFQEFLLPRILQEEK